MVRAKQQWKRRKARRAELRKRFYELQDERAAQLRIATENLRDREKSWAEIAGEDG